MWYGYKILAVPFNVIQTSAALSQCEYISAKAHGQHNPIKLLRTGREGGISLSYSRSPPPPPSTA